MFTHYSLCTVESPRINWYAVLGEILAGSFVRSSALHSSTPYSSIAEAEPCKPAIHAVYRKVPDKSRAYKHISRFLHRL